MEQINTPKVLVVTEDVNYNKTSCGLINTKIIYTLSKIIPLRIVSISVVPDGFKLMHTGEHVNYAVPKMAGYNLLSKIPFLRSIPEWTSGINHNMLPRYAKWKAILKQELSANEYDIILILGSGMGWYSHMAMQKTQVGKAKRIYNFHDPFPMAMLPPPLNARFTFGQKMLVKRMNKVVDEAFQCWSPSQRLVEWLAPKYPNMAKKIAYMPHLALVPKEIYDPSKQDEALPINFTTNTCFFVMHIGSLFNGRSPIGLLTAIQTWVKQRPEAAMHLQAVFIGSVNKEYEKAFESVKYDPNFTLLLGQRISYQSALSLQQKASVNIIIEMEVGHSPQLLGKVADSVWANRPILCLGTPNSEARRLLGDSYKYQAGNSDVEEIVIQLNDLYEKWLQNRNLTLQRNDLLHYMSGERMQQHVISLL